MLQPTAPAPPSGRSGSQAPAGVDDYQIFYDDDPEEYQALDRPGDFYRGQPSVDGGVTDEEQHSTPRRWWLAGFGALDELLRHPLVFTLSSLRLIITPVITSLPYVASAVGFATVVMWRHFCSRGNGSRGSGIGNGLIGLVVPESSHSNLLGRSCYSRGSSFVGFLARALGRWHTPGADRAGRYTLVVAIHPTLRQHG